MAVPPIAALEIGTSRTVVCVGECDVGDRIKILGVGTYPTTGVRKGQIIDPKQARVSVEEAARMAEKLSGVGIQCVLMAVSGEHIQSFVHPGMLTLRASDRVVSKLDIEMVNESAHDITLDDDRQILHTINQSFTLDDQPGIENPEGMRCNVLMLNVMALHGLKNRIDNAISVAKSARMDITDVTFSAICSSMVALTPEQKRNGVLLIDLGGGTTNYAVYCNNIISAAGSLAIGGDHVTNDLAVAFNMSVTFAEELKIKEGCAVLETESSAQRLTLPAEVGVDERMISRKALYTVINARMDETFRVLRSKLDEAGVMPHLGSGVVLVGQGAYLRRVTDLAHRVFGLPCRVGVPLNVDGLEKEEQPAALATAVGLVSYGIRTYKEEHNFLPWLGKLFARGGSRR